MKNRLKKIILALTVSLAMLSLFGCAKEATVEPMSAETEQMMAYSAESMFQQIISMSDEEVGDLIEAYSEQQDTIMINGLNAWLTSEEDLGAFVEIKGTDVIQDSDGGYTATVHAAFEQRDCEFILGVNKRMTKYTNLSFSPVYTTGELVSEGFGNLIVGMGMVFIVLIFLAWVISLFKYIHIAEEKAKKKAQEKEAALTAKAEPEPIAAVPVPAPAPKAAAPLASGDDEVAVVIAAAIAAYEADTGRHFDELRNGLTVRKIRRGRR